MRKLSIVIALLVAGPLVSDGVPSADAKPKKAAKAKAKPKPKADKQAKTPKKPKGKQSAKTHMDRAAKAHKAGKYEVALTELEAAYEIDPQPKLLFAIAQVQHKLDRCDGAITNYEKFLATTTDKKKTTIVKQAIDACTAKIATAPMSDPEPKSDGGVFRDKKPDEPVAAATTPPAGTEPADPTPPPTSPPATPELQQAVDDDSALPGRRPETPPTARSPWYKDVIGDALVVGGVACGVISVVFYSGARSDLDAAEAAGSLPEYESLVERAQDKRMYAVMIAGGGAVLLGAGVLRYALRDSGESRGVAIAPTAGGGLVTWSGGF